MSDKRNGFRILYTNEELLVVHKPADVAMDGDRGQNDVTVEEWVKTAPELHQFLQRPLPSGNLHAGHGGNQGVTEKRLKFVHQLDYATSGVLCLAFSKDMASRLAHCFEMRYTRKFYLALVYGHVDDSTWTLPPILERAAPLSSSVLVSSSGAAPCEHVVAESTSPNSSLLPAAATSASVGSHSYEVVGAVAVDTADPEGFRMKVDRRAPSEGGTGRSASTVMQVLERGYLTAEAFASPLSGVTTDVPTVPVTKLLLRPLSGRRHQLRLHCADIGHPIVGDATYADPTLISSSASSPSPGLNEETVSADRSSSVRRVKRMMLHAWRLQFAESVEITSEDRRSRVEAKKKRRRETLGLQERTVQFDEAAAAAGETAAEDDGKGTTSVFESADPFQGFLRGSV